jgi:uncharacterized membrane protein YraQ (UPF0718 family)/copper chaperone CopZ
MSPYLLFGFLAAGLLSVLVSPAWVERHLGGRGFSPVLKASLFGVPLPLCSCAVIPVSASIRRHGASRSATASFLLSTPQTGVDSIAVTYALLGPVFAVFRPIAALVTGLVGGGLVRMLGDRDGDGNEGESSRPRCTAECCSGKQSKNLVARVLSYGLVTLPKDIGFALLVGILIAGAMAAFIPQNQLNAYIGGGILSILLMMAAGVPVYVCATASVPIAAGFMHLGASPGAALAFLIAGPATNAATFTTVWKVLGRRTAVLYLTTVAISAIACGLVLDWLMPDASAIISPAGEHSHGGEAGAWYSHAAAVVLLSVLIFSYWASGRRGRAAAQDLETQGEPGVERFRIQITGMTCNHCAGVVKRTLSEHGGVMSAEVSLKDGRALVTGKSVDRAQLVNAVTELGYPAALLEDTE